MEEQTISSRRPFEGKLISVRVDTVALPSGRETSREIVEHPGAVAILAWDGARLALVRQWRHAIGATLLEIPAGTLEPGEEPRTTAERELGEECGLATDDWARGPSFYSAPGFCTELLTLFLATQLREAEVQAAEDEDLELSWLSMPDALDAIDAARITDAKSLAGILWLSHRLMQAG